MDLPPEWEEEPRVTPPLCATAIEAELFPPLPSPVVFGAAVPEVWMDGLDRLVRRDALVYSRSILAQCVVDVLDRLPRLDASDDAFGLRFNPALGLRIASQQGPDEGGWFGSVRMQGEYVFNLTDPDRRARLMAGLGSALGAWNEPGVQALGGTKLLAFLQRDPTRSPLSVEASGVTHLSVLQQMDDGPCGYHALWNALIAVSLCQIDPDDVDARNSVFALLHDRVAFWAFYANMERALRDHGYALELATGVKGGMWPWRKEDIDSGILERTHVAYLIASHPLFARAGGDSFFSVLPSANPQEMAGGAMSVDEIKAVSDTFALFSSPDVTKAVHAFVVGAHSHWLTVVAHKSGPRMEVIFLDSNNAPLFDASDPQMAHILRNSGSHGLFQGGTPRAAETEREEYAGTLRASRGIADIMNDCINGNKNFTSIVLDNVVDLLLAKFTHRVLRRSQYGGLMSLDGAIANPAFESWVLEWLTQWEPPATLRSGVLAFLIGLGVSSLSPRKRDALVEWALLLSSADAIRDSPSPVVQDLTSVLHKIIALF